MEGPTQTWAPHPHHAFLRASGHCLQNLQESKAFRKKDLDRECGHGSQQGSEAGV